MDPLDKVGGARAELALDARKFTQGVDQGIGGLHKLETAGNRTGQTVGQAADGMSTKMLLAGGAIAAGIGHAVKTFISFEKQMNAVGAVTGATGDRFKELEGLALKIGQTTVFSATEAAAAIEELAKAGQSVDSILAGAADGAVALAAAAGEGIPQAAAQMAATLNIFKLGGDQAVHVADLFAAAASKTNASAEGIAQGLSNAAAVFTLLGVPVEEAVGVLAKFNDESIVGAEAGTALKSSILSLLTPTQQQTDLMEKYGIELFNTNGEFVGMAALAEQLKVGLGGLTEAQRAATLAILGGSYGIQGLNVLYKSGADVINQYTDMVDDAGTAAEQAAARNQGLSGALESLSGSLEVAEIKLGAGIAPALETTAKVIESVVNAFGDLSPTLQKMIGYFAVGTAGTLLFVGAGIKTASMLQGMFRSLSTVTTWLTGSTAATNAQTLASGRMAGANNAATLSTNRLAGAARGLAGALRVAVVAAGALVIMDSISKAAEGPQAGPSTSDRIGSSVEAGIGGFLNTLDKKLTGDTNAFGEWLIDDANETLSDQELFKKVGDLGFKINQSFMGGLLTKTSESTIEGLGDTTVRDIQDLAAQMGTSFEQALIFKAESLGVTTDAMKALTAATDAEAAAAAQTKADTVAQAEAAKRAADPVYALNQAIAEGVTAAHEKQAEDALAAQVQAELNREFIAGSNAILPYTRNAEDVAAATADFNETLQDQVDAVAQSSRGLDDLSADLPGLQQGFAKAGDSLYRMLLNADKAGEIDLSAADREAFRLADNLSETEQGIDRVSAAIANNQGDLSMWEQRIALVDSVLGSNRDTLAEWERELALGHVTQEEFNAAVADGRAVRAFDTLKDLYDAGKLSLAEYNEILEAGTWLRDRSVGGIQDEQAEIAKLLPDLAEYVKQHDDQSRALEDLDPAQRARIAALQGENAQMILQTALLVKFLEFTGQITPEAGTQLLLDLTQFDPAMQAVLEDYGFLAEPVTTPVEADTSAFDETMKTKREEGNQPITVPVEFGGTPETRSRGGSDGPIPPIVTPPADTTQTEASLNALPAAAETAGTDSGEAFTTGLDTGTDGAPAEADAAAAAVLSAFDAYQQSVYNSGFNFGWNWDLGVLSGLQAMAPVIFEQARIIAQGVEDITKSQIDAHSPSRKSIDLYGEWNAGAVVALSDTRAIEDAARRGAERLEWATSRGIGRRPRDLFGDGANPTVAGQAQPIVIQQGNTRGDLVIAPNFHGITDHAELTGRIRTELVDGLNRWEASEP